MPSLTIEDAPAERGSNEGNRVVFHFNSDLSGDVEIVRCLPAAQKPNASVWIPGDAILQFVAEFVRRQRVSQVESQPWHEVLGVGVLK